MKTIPRTQQSLFSANGRLQMTDSIEMTIASLQAYGPTHKHWAIAWSGGKDSSALLTLVIWLILAGKVAPPETLTVLYADTRMELLPLFAAACAIREELADKADALAALGVILDVRTVMASMDKRFLVYILGRGVPPPNNNTLRWCTRQIKVDPMAAELACLFEGRVEPCAACNGAGRHPQSGEVEATVDRLRQEIGPDFEVSDPVCAECRGTGRVSTKILMLTGVRQGESAVRDGRIAMSCGRNGGECGQGWYQETLPDQLCDTLAPLLHWRVCHVWEWLKHWAPEVTFGDWSTAGIADAYGGDEAEEINARTGCVGCPLAERDTALDAVVAQPKWAYLAPLKGLRPLYRELRTPLLRLRKLGGEHRKDGSLVANQQRMGPITIEGRRMALARVLAIQAEINADADRLGRPRIDLLNAEEVARIGELLDAGTWPQKWTGDEPSAADDFEPVYADGSVQALLFRAVEDS